MKIIAALGSTKAQVSFLRAACRRTYATEVKRASRDAGGMKGNAADLARAMAAGQGALLRGSQATREEAPSYPHLSPRPALVQLHACDRHAG